MPRIADYVVLVDRTLTVDEDRPERKIGFILPSGAQPSQAVLVWFADTIQPGFGFQILVNDNDQFSANIAGDVFHSFHEVVRGLQVGENFITFRRLSGSFRISDVVLWFQVDI